MADTQEKTIRIKPLLEGALLLAAFWPIWAWYVGRSVDTSDEPWGLIALATAVYFLYRTRTEEKNTPQSGGSRVLGIAALATYIATFPFAPNLILSILVLITFWFIMPTSRSLPGRVGIAGLLLISLPLIPSLNFYGGYPLRLLTAAGARLLLSCLGMSISQQGTMLNVQGKLVAIDAPCSGISMVWAAAYIAFLMSATLKLNGKKTALLLFLAAMTVLTGNILRATTLVMYDTIAGHQADLARMMPEPIVHLAVGLTIFAIIALTTIFLALRLQQSRPSEPAPITLHPPRWLPTLSPAVNYLVIPLCLAAAAMPLVVKPGQGHTEKYNPMEWPTVIAGNALTAVASLPEENAFAREFPGAMRRFTDGKNAYFIRAVNRETRQLHPSNDCFRGMGYAITFRPIYVDTDGNRWNTFLATKDDRSFLVMERLYDLHGSAWTDVSAWYWSAALGQSKGPWWAVTMARPATAEESAAAK